MAIRIPVGGENFDALRNEGSYYVDKTELIYELVHDARNAVTLFTRPRRFGKTLVLRMLESFFDIARDSRAVFAGLDIMKHADFCVEWMNQYPVLYISFKDVEALRFETAYGKLKAVIAEVCGKYPFLAEHPKADPDDRLAFARLKSQNANDWDIQTALRTLTRMLHAVYGKPVILLIDEYDVPLAKANERKEGGERYYPQMLEVMRGILSAALKSNDCLKFGVVTGCLRIAKESIFTRVNNFKTYSVLDRRFSRYFGFTQEEIDRLLQAAGLQETAERIRAWYNGYLFGDSAVYCPWDVMNYVADVLYDQREKPKNYWKNTSGNGILREFVEQRQFQVKGKFETLMNGGTITQAVSDAMAYDTLHASEENLWSVLLMTGYLTKADPDSDAADGAVALRIPNMEIASIFHETVASFFADHVDAAELRAMMDALWAGDAAAASKALSDLLWQTISYMDYHEDYYHAFLAGIFVGRGYEVESNRERGLGRPDIQLIDDARRRALILEAKKSASKDQMERDCEEALRQIVAREYAKGLECYDQVLCYGVSFFQKSALVKKL